MKKNGELVNRKREYLKFQLSNLISINDISDATGIPQGILRRFIGGKTNRLSWRYREALKRYIAAWEIPPCKTRKE